MLGCLHIQSPVGLPGSIFVSLLVDSIILVPSETNFPPRTWSPESFWILDSDLYTTLVSVSFLCLSSNFPICHSFSSLSTHAFHLPSPLFGLISEQNSPTSCIWMMSPTPHLLSFYALQGHLLRPSMISMLLNLCLVLNPHLEGQK